MTDARADRVETIFADALDIPREQRREFLDRACESDLDLREEVEALLDADASHPDGFLDAPMLVGDGDVVGSCIDGKYRVVRQLGQGGMGVVYLAEQIRPKRLVAVKLLRPGLAAGARRFEHEMELLGRLRHPGIAQIHDAGALDDHTPYFVMEHVDGVPLCEHAERRRLSTRQRLELFASICDAVQHAHQRGVVHRDLKPANILVDAGGQPKVLDFGIALATNADSLAITQTTDRHQLLGTLAYMSPEQIEGDPGAIDTRTDVYALGVTMFELLSGRQPIDVSDCSIAEAARRIRDERPAPLRETSRELRGDIETICATAMDKEKSRRYASASELAADIRRFLAGEPIVARPPSTLYQLSKFARRNIPLVSLAGALVLLLIVALAGTSAALVELSRQRDQALAASADAEAANLFFKEILNAVYFDEYSTEPVTIVQLLDGAVAKLNSGVLADRPRVEAAVLIPIGVAYRELGEIDKAIAQLGRSVALYRPLSEPEHLAEALQELGSAHLLTTDLAEAERRLTEALEIYRRHFGDEHMGTAIALDQLSQVRGRQGRDDESLALARQSLEIRQRLESDDDAATARAHNTIGVILRRRGDLGEAAEHYRKAVDGYRASRGDDHPLLASSLNNLAICHMYAGNFDAAEPLLLEALAIRRNAFGPDHHTIGGTLNALGGIAAARGDLIRSSEFYQASVDNRVACLGPDHTQVAIARTNLATELRKLGRLEDSEQEAREALRINLTAHGDDHLSTADSMQALGLTVLDLGRAGESEAILRDAHRIIANQRGKEHPLSAYAGALAARALTAQSRFEEAEELLSTALTRYDAITDPHAGDLAYRARVLAWLAELCDAADRPEDAATWRRLASAETTDSR